MIKRRPTKTIAIYKVYATLSEKTGKQIPDKRAQPFKVVVSYKKSALIIPRKKYFKLKNLPPNLNITGVINNTHLIK